MCQDRCRVEGDKKNWISQVQDKIVQLSLER